MPPSKDDILEEDHLELELPHANTEATVDDKCGETITLKDVATHPGDPTIANTEPTTDLELALSAELQRKTSHIEMLKAEIEKLQGFVAKRKQEYKRKSKDKGAPKRALSAYNFFVKERFRKLSKDNEEALNSSDANLTIQRKNPAELVSSSGQAWKALGDEEKKYYEGKAKEDRERFEKEIAAFAPTGTEKKDKKKRNKTGYNMFFSAKVAELQCSGDIPTERGHVARAVGLAWKTLSSEEKKKYDKLADEANKMTNAVDEEEETEGTKKKRKKSKKAEAKAENATVSNGIPDAPATSYSSAPFGQVSAQCAQYAQYPGVQIGQTSFGAHPAYQWQQQQQFGGGYAAADQGCTGTAGTYSFQRHIPPQSTTEQAPAHFLPDTSGTTSSNVGNGGGGGGGGVQTMKREEKGQGIKQEENQELV